jgi:hypothetical protein
MKEKFLEKQVSMPWYTIRHNDNFRMKWDIFVILLAIWNCISIPFDVSFEPDMGAFYANVEQFIDLCFGLDILIAFRTTFIDQKTGFEVIDNKKMAWNYIITGRFFVDLAASIPFEEIYLMF